jgi:hypothetical protein
VASNGRLPASSLGAIPGGRLEKHAANSWLRLRAKIGAAAGIWICPTSSRTAYRTYAEQEYFWNLYIHGNGALAARPGTSNHGWGVAVDVPQPVMASLINRYGADYGWQKRWSDAPSEWWHFKYAPQYDKHKGEKPGGNPKHPSHYLLKDEKHWVRVLRRERRLARKAGGWSKVGDDHLAMAKRAKAWLRRRMSHIKKAAGSESGGWKKHHRRVRYNYIKKVLDG